MPTASCALKQETPWQKDRRRGLPNCLGQQDARQRKSAADPCLQNSGSTTDCRTRSHARKIRIAIASLSKFYSTCVAPTKHAYKRMFLSLLACTKESVWLFCQFMGETQHLILMWFKQQNTTVNMHQLILWSFFLCDNTVEFNQLTQGHCF